MAKKYVLILVFILILFLHLRADEEHGSRTKDFLGKTLNFVVLFGALAYLLRKPLLNFLETRSIKIQESLEDMKTSRQEAEQKLTEIKDRLSLLEGEIENIKKEGETSGLKERDRIIEQARKEVNRIKKFSQEEIGMLTRVGMADLREYAAELSTALAQERIKQKITPEMASRLIDESIEKIEGLYENTNTDKEIRSGTR